MLCDQNFNGNTINVDSQSSATKDQQRLIQARQLLLARKGMITLNNKWTLPVI